MKLTYPLQLQVVVGETNTGKFMYSMDAEDPDKVRKLSFVLARQVADGLLTVSQAGVILNEVLGQPNPLQIPACKEGWYKHFD